MRLILLVLAAILVLGLVTIGSAVSPCPAAASSSPAIEAIPTIKNATLSNENTTPSKTSFQASYLSLSLSTDKSIYLTGETVNITVSTNAINTHIRVLAQLPGGYQETISSFTTNATHTLSWTAPSTPGVITLTCEADAIMEAWDNCARYVCVDDDCSWEYYPCLRSIPVTDNAASNVRIFSRTTSISGNIIDTNQRPVPGAAIYLASTMQSTTSNGDGYYEFSSYQLDNNYALLNQIPTATETVSVEAIACEPQPGKTIQIQAESTSSNINFTLKRAFYPPDIDLSEFNFDAFPGWQEANEYSTWQNILGITIDGAVEPGKLSYGTKDTSPQLFNIGDKKLCLVTNPEFGHYFLELQGAQNTGYAVAAATTLNNLYFEPVTVSGSIEGKNDQRLRLTVNPGGIELKVIRSASPLLFIIPAVVVLLGGLMAAYFLTRGKFHGTVKTFISRKLPKTKLATGIKAKMKSTAAKVGDDSAVTKIKVKSTAAKVGDDPAVTKVKKKSTVKKTKKKQGKGGA
ncbi:MAG: carboxypeptidase-like regulatory domain-containing protein [Dehalococcoidia bacterium]|nr:carboxypeptidase-like regulatory domain-containing protein [Dehalococcoidia bacterium]